MALFLTLALAIWGVMHTYVFWRLSSIPWVAAHVPAWVLVCTAVPLWASYVVARILDAKDLQQIAWPIEILGANWIGVLFLLFSALLFVDLITLGGNLFSQYAPRIRTGTVLVALALALFAFVQALRPPVLREYEVALVGLPPERDGTILVQISDLHLGNILGRRWLLRLCKRVADTKPDLLVLVGDVVDGNVGRVEPLKDVLSMFKAPLGVYAVTGNHEYYAGAERSVALFREAGMRVLRDTSEEVAPGLIIAGVDDLTARAQFGASDNPVQKTLSARRPGATIFLSHSPIHFKEAAALHANLMLCGHTHAGQIWPFKYLVNLRYPLAAGLYKVNGMTMIVCRGTGTWGPRMRLWRPSEIVKITLRQGK